MRTRRPIICLLGDYRFADGLQDDKSVPSHLIPKGWDGRFTITMASECELGREGETLYQDLDHDLLNGLSCLWEADPKNFFSNIKAALGRRTEAQRLFATSKIKSSHYLRYWRMDNDAPSGCVLKWLRPAFLNPRGGT